MSMSPLVIELFLFFLFNIAQTIALIFLIILYMEHKFHSHTWENWLYAWLGTLVALLMVSFFMYHDVVPIYNDICNKQNKSQY